MTESTLITDIRAILDASIPSYTIDVISRKNLTVSSIDTTVAIVFKDKSIDVTLLKALIDYQVQNDRNKLNFETKKELGNLDFEVIIINVEIFY